MDLFSLANYQGLMCERFVKQYGISEARKNLRSICDELTATGTCVRITRKGSPSVIMMLEEDNILDNSRYEFVLARLITIKLLGGAPLQLRRTQAAELSKLKLEQLMVLMAIKKLPIETSARDDMVSKVGNEDILTRMERRWTIAKTISEGKKKGLYETIESGTGRSHE